MIISILGSRGIPGNYGGFETCAEELATRFVKNGHEVIVYCCKPYSKNNHISHNGVRRVIIPTVRRKGFEKLIFTFLSLLHVTFTKTDIVLMLGVSASVFCFIPRLTGKKVVINVDGLEWRRDKWGRIASAYLRFSERAACLTTNHVVTDAICVQEYYRNAYGKETTFIPYGVEAEPVSPDVTLTLLKVTPKGYVLYVSRFDPENNALLVRQAFERIKTDMKLVMLGDAPFAKEYIQEVMDTSDARIFFPGAIYGKGYRELQCHAYIYIQATEVGGTHPALVEAMGYGNCIIANDVPEHREVLGYAGLYYDGTREGLVKRLQEVLDHPSMVLEYRKRIQERSGRYSWEQVVKDYENLFLSLIYQ
jgi:glycosyltransferase involved in cell wall biosynthesis